MPQHMDQGYQRIVDLVRGLILNTAVSLDLPDNQVAAESFDQRQPLDGMPVPEPAVMRADIADVGEQLQRTFEHLTRRQAEVLGHRAPDFWVFRGGEPTGQFAKGHQLRDDPDRRHERCGIFPAVMVNKHLVAIFGPVRKDR